MNNKRLLGIVATLTVLTTTSISSVTWQSQPSIAQTNLPINRILSQVKGKTQVPIFLPSRLPFSGRVYFDSEVTEKGYSVSFNYTPNCQATACSIGYIEAEKGGQFVKPEQGITKTFKNVQLAKGTKGVFHNGCGAYCTATLEWQSQGVLYRVSVKNGEENTLVQIANSAIQAGRR